MYGNYDAWKLATPPDNDDMAPDEPCDPRCPDADGCERCGSELAVIQNTASHIAERALASGDPEDMRRGLEIIETSGRLAKALRKGNAR